MSRSLSPEVAKEERKAVLLLVDDDSLVVESLGAILKKKYHLMTAESRLDAQNLLVKTDYQPQIALIDLGLPPVPHGSTEGFALIEDLLTFDPDMKILVLSGNSEAVNIRHALTLGAVDFIPEGASEDLLQSRLLHHLMLQDIEKNNSDTYTESAIIGDSSAMTALREKIEQMAESVYPVLIEGELGTGKASIAKALHQQSSRREKPYVYVNCAAMDAGLFEARLFGYSKGVMDDVNKESSGYIGEAGEGTLFLDEVSQLSYEFQIKLVNALENEEYSRVGETRNRKIKARLIVATNKQLKNEVKASRFNEDLYHYLSTLIINAPSLSEREHDSLLLMRHFRRLYKDSIKPFTLNAAATALWMQYDFPGNIRELRNIVIRLGTKYSSTNINYEQLKEELELEVPAVKPEKLKAGFESGKFNDAWLMKKIAAGAFDLKEAIGSLESHCIQLAMKVYDNDPVKTAKALNINRTTLFNMINKKNENGAL